MTDSNGVSRIPLRDPGYRGAPVYMFHQYAVGPAGSRLYGLFHNKMITMDLESGSWAFPDITEKRPGGI